MSIYRGVQKIPITTAFSLRPKPLRPVLIPNDRIDTGTFPQASQGIILILSNICQLSPIASTPSIRIEPTCSKDGTPV